MARTARWSTPVAVLMVVAVGACADGQAPPTTRAGVRPDGTVRLMSYNVNFGLAGDAAGVAVVADADADVVFLQETNGAWERALVARLGARYPHRRFTPPPGWPAGGMGVLSRYPLVALDELPSDGGPFFAWRAVLATPRGPLQVLNVHLRPPISDGGSWLVGYFSTRDVRAREIKAHVAALAPLPTVVLGDFNEEPDGLALAYLASLGYRDAITEHVGARPTWAWQVGDTTLRLQLDHLLYDRSFTVPVAQVVAGGRSDHQAIWADVVRAP